MPTIREARLRPEFAYLYPGLQPGVWVPARLLVDREVVRQERRRREGTIGGRLRDLNDQHFEFRDVPASDSAERPAAPASDV
jgi:hypothetical protein